MKNISVLYTCLDNGGQGDTHPIQAMAEAGVIRCHTPCCVSITQQPFLDCRRLVSRSVEVAVATDFNPGSAPSFDLPLAMMLSCNLGRLTPRGSFEGSYSVCRQSDRHG